MGRLAEAALRRHRAITIIGLILLASLAWAWLANGAGMAMGAQVAFSPFPHDEIAASGRAMAWNLARLLITFSMWTIMMVAMMLPAAAPTILLYARAASHRAPAGARPPSTAFFLAGYLIVWAGFSAAATGLQMLLGETGLLAPQTMGSASVWLSSGVLIAVGLYQFSPAKNACLAHCRSPAEFLARHYRPGRAGAVRLGLGHGAYCVGCCWALMALLFVGGVMNLAWIAILTLVVAAEKLAPGGRYLALFGGGVFLVWGAATLLV